MAPLPLRGRSVVVTRATAQASTLVEHLEALGAEVVAVPVIEVADPADGGASLREALGSLDRYSWLVVTSANGADRVCAVGSLREAPVKVAAIGPGTVEALDRHGVPVDLVPGRFVAEGLLDVFPAPPPAGGRVLLAQAAGARPVLHDGLTAKGWDVDLVEAYRTVHPRLSAEVVDRASGADAITFTSASTVRGYVGAAGLEAVPPVVATIGPITSEASRELGVEVDVEAREHTIPGLVASLVDHLGPAVPEP